MFAFARRVGLSPEQRGETSGRDTCPDIWELDNGAFAVIGTDVTEQVKGLLPEGMHCAPYERVVIVTRRTLIAAKRDLPDV
ncbi:hypothetical protein FH608_021860 [Nonomuraea phyllanthi]|uniref:Uncharacterized protein n=1 Tax=Nonomuraea phyllanthi TaxID=2219224 RepID=A0A5C4WBG3_9ACTN|nr:hypothetical protein [Nonomuraea phyllanthi]KAB8192991.1 hypothetical protein FH608_021860 [Nonomuraea phyllanthi]